MTTNYVNNVPQTL